MPTRAAAAAAAAATLILAGCATGPSSGTGANGLYKAAIEAREAGKTDEAMDDLRRAVATEHQYLDAWRALVQLYSEEGRLSEITGELEQRSAQSPNDPVLHYALGLADFAKAVSAVGPAIDQFTIAQRLQPEQPEYTFRIGVALLEAERFKEALEPLRKAVALDPKQAKFHVPLGLCLARLGDRPAALTEFRTLLDLRPAQRDVELAEKALARLDDQAKNVPRSEQENFQRAIVMMNQADAPQQAIDALQDILDRFPDLAAVHTLMGLCYERLDDSGPAVEHLKRAIELAPDDAEAYLYMADLYLAKEKLDRAEDYYRLALQRNPLLPAAYQHLGEMAVIRSDAQAALEDYRALVALKGDDPNAHKHMAQGYELAGQYDQAETELKQLIDKFPKDVDARMRLGYLYTALNQRLPDKAAKDRYAQLAIDAFQQVLDVQPENVAASRAIRQLKGP